MKTPLLIAFGLGVNLNAASNVSFSFGPTFSGGEISKAYSYDMHGSGGIYEFGLNISGESKYLESSLQIETGR